ncbi:DMT family transporter [Ornithinimicrobium ciconiae]|uniref:DMT family transporter n=1 Tax=Ornithinimicrobium ciconiae TaxID=2594265 RepID=A0A516GDM9_9MICO|nr:DMT family transporter [Ornithinimicrobium ciconiae]QDO89623.1 DMT family transporter [Ornithinimicrobium ciconiae]
MTPAPPAAPTTAGRPWQAKYAAIALIWGSSYLLMKVGVEALSGVQVATLRVLCGIAVLLLLLRLTGGRLPRGRRTWGHLLVTGTLLCTIPWTLFAVGEERVDSAIAGMSNAVTPVATVLCSMLLLRSEPVGRRRMVGVAIGFVGVMLIFQPWSVERGPDPVGFAMVLAASASYGVGWTYVRRFLRSVDPGGLSMPTAQVLVATVQMPIVLLLWWWLGSGEEISTPWSLHGTDWVVPVLAVVVLGVVGTGLAQWLQFDVVRAAGPTVATSVTYPITVVAVLLGVLVLGEQLGPVVLLGGVTVLAASVLIGRAPRPPGTPTDPSPPPVDAPSPPEALLPPGPADRAPTSARPANPPDVVGQSSAL